MHQIKNVYFIYVTALPVGLIPSEKVIRQMDIAIVSGYSNKAFSNGKTIGNIPAVHQWGLI